MVSYREDEGTLLAMNIDLRTLIGPAKCPLRPHYVRSHYFFTLALRFFKTFIEFITDTASSPSQVIVLEMVNPME